MKFFPQGKRLFVELRPVEELKTAGGVYLPDKHHEESRLGKVVAIGGDVTRYKVDDTVLVTWFGGVAIHLPAIGLLKDTHRIFSEDEIQALVEL